MRIIVILIFKQFFFFCVVVYISKSVLCLTSKTQATRVDDESRNSATRVL